MDTPGVVRTAAKVSVGLALAYAVLLPPLAMGLADSLIFLPPPASYGPDDGAVLFPSASGDTVAGFHRAVEGASLTVLFAHGNAEDAGHVLPLVERIAELGVSVLVFDYPGYGLSEGRPSERGAYAAADAAYTYLVESLDVPPSTVVLHGRSLGGAVLADLASRRPVGALVLESTFVSAYRVMTRYRVLPIDQFETLGKLSGFAGPALVIHGDRDQVIAPWHGRRIYDDLPGTDKRALWVPDAGHNDLALVAGGRYWHTLERLFRDVEARLETG